jgi:signal transduction histidine kinase
VRIHLRKQNDQVLLEIKDNGRGFNVPNDWLDLIRQGHLGLAGMHERAEAAGGTLDVQSTPGEGTLISIKIPALSGKLQ